MRFVKRVGGFLAIILGIGLWGAYYKQSKADLHYYPKRIERNYHQQPQAQSFPTKGRADSVLSDNVRKQVGNQIVWNGYGAYVVNNNQTNLNANINSAPYAVNHLDSRGRAWLSTPILKCRISPV